MIIPPATPSPAAALLASGIDDAALGATILALLEELAQFSESPDALTCSYLTPAHLATAEHLRALMAAAGLAVHRDAVGNVVGVLSGDGATARALLTGSHYDTVVNAGKFDGRLGIVLPLVVAAALHRSGRRLPYPLEIIAFAEEEGVRFRSTFLGSRAIVGRFETRVLDATDAAGISLREALRTGGDPGGAAPGNVSGQEVDAIAALARDPATVSGFVEVHIEQGPVLLEAGRAVGVVTSIAGSVRSTVTVEGLAGHSGTVPMALRHDAAAAAAEIVLAVERHCSGVPGLVGTVGKLEVPDGAINVIPGRCHLSIDIRADRDAVRDAADAEVTAEIERIAARRGVTIERRRVLEVSCVPCDAGLQQAWDGSIERVTGAPALRLASGAGHDAMMMAHLTPVGMLFVRCGNGGISHHPAETLSIADAQVAARVFLDFLLHFEGPA